MAFVVAALSAASRREAAQALLSAAGHTCVFFDTVEAAVAEAQAGTADVLIVDDLPPAGTQQAVAVPIVTYEALFAFVSARLAQTSRVLLVEDEDAIAVPVIDGLARYGIQADRVASGGAALDAPPAAMVLLDLGLPDIDGLEVCRRLRSRGVDVPIIMLTARGEETDRVVGLELGADDYLAKPFSMRELVARIRAVGRRTGLAA